MASDNQVKETVPPAAGKDVEAGVGLLLRQTRETRGLDLAAAAKNLRIRQGYLQAIEEGRYGDLPGHAYAIGFVRGYADFLGLDGAEMVRRFKLESDAFSGRPELVFPTAVSESSIPGGWLLILALLAAVAAYGAWYIYQSRMPSVAESVPALPDRLAALIHRPVGDGSEIVPVQRQDSAKPDAAPAVAAAAPAPVSTVATTTQTPPAGHEDVVPPAEEEPASAAAPPAEPSPSAAAETKPLDAKAAAKAQREAKKAEAAAAKTAVEAQAKAPLDAASAPPPASAPADAADRLAAVETVRPSDTTQKEVEPDAAVAAPSRVLLRADQDCWVEIRDSQGHVIYSRLLRKGESYAVPGRSGLVMTAGNAGAMTLVVDGKPMPPLGRMGMVRRDVPLDPETLATEPGE